MFTMKLFHLLWLFILWMNVDESFQQNECQDVDVPNGFAVGPYNNTLYFACDKGYKLFTNGWWSEAKCKNGVWIGLERCIEKSSCGQFPVIPNGEVKSQPTDYADGESVRISCNNGYDAQADHLTCHEGKWCSSASSLQTICTPISTHCSAPPQVDNAVVLTSYQTEYLSGSEVTYRCRDTYAVEGEATITCTDGKWGMRTIECPDRCTVMNPLSNVNIINHRPGNKLTKGQKLEFYCHLRSHVLKGSSTVECLANGQWSDPFPTCGPPVGCGKPPHLEDGDTMGTTKYRYNHDERVEYICQNLYTMEGGPFKTCNNGEWTGRIRCIKPCTVDQEAMDRHNIIFRYVPKDKLYFNHNDVIEFMCKSRMHQVGRVAMRQRCIEGEMQLPSCQ